MITHRAGGQIERDRDGADAGRRTQEAEPPRPGMQDVAGIGGQKRRGAAEQDREQVERNGAEHDLLMPDIAEAGDDGGPVRRSGVVFCGGGGTSDTSTPAAARKPTAVA